MIIIGRKEKVMLPVMWLVVKALGRHVEVVSDQLNSLNLTLACSCRVGESIVREAQWW